jgi:hypothetical protein
VGGRGQVVGGDFRGGFDEGELFGNARRRRGDNGEAEEGSVQREERISESVLKGSDSLNGVIERTRRKRVAYRLDACCRSRHSRRTR